jgi:uncharacterized protein (TIGR00725 family)
MNPTFSGAIYVAVVGPGEATDPHLSLAGAVGELLAVNGAVLICGGLGGVMEAACRGAFEAGGTTVGLLPGEHRSAGNPFLSAAIATGLGELRNALVVRSADAVIGVGRSWGTLGELALAARAKKPVILLDSWRISDGPPGDPELGFQATSPEHAVQLALAAAIRRQRSPG